MRVSLAWLREWIELPDEATLVERLDMGGFEDAAIERRGPDLSALVVGEVVACEKHPQADRLSACRVAVGAAEPLEIVCGAPNVARGQKVAVAPVGALLPNGLKIARAKIRGLVSNGMICSASELGIAESSEGILVLPEAARVGAPLAEWLEGGDAILEVGITPNRGDTASLLGLAREVQALIGGSPRWPDCTVPEQGAAASASLRVAIDAPEGCFHYAARVVRGLRVGPSPDWLVERLEASGLRSINNVVDATNYAMLEFGQPLHAFDLARIAGGEIRVRRACAGESLETLDGQRRTLAPEDLVIADREGPLALAGVMGGRATEVGDTTREILIESAHFEPIGVRLAARRHGLRSEASYRFERGVDRDGIARAADRCARLVAELAGGQVAPGRIEAHGDAAPRCERIRLEATRANRLLGTQLDASAMRSLLERAQIVCEEPRPGWIEGRVPSHRNDLHLPQDLIEEIARLHGYDRIPIRLPQALLAPIEVPRRRRLAEQARDALVGAGYFETVSFPFLSEHELAGLGLPPGGSPAECLRLDNPIREEEPLLRSSLLPSLLRLARQNRSRQIETQRLFEVSRVFLPRGPGELPQEPLRLAALLLRGESSSPWGQTEAHPFYEMRGVAERLFEQAGYVACLRRHSIPPHLHPGAAAAIEVGGQVIGALGGIHPAVAAHWEIDLPCAVLELDLSQLAELPGAEPRFRESSRFPLMRRDLAVVAGRDLAAGDLAQALRESAGSDCTSVELFDRYEGRGVPEGQVSLAFRLVFQREDRTLRDEEVNRAIERAVRMLDKRFGLRLR